jgi:predicted Zn-dependent protease with MMP-like domain
LKQVQRNDFTGSEADKAKGEQGAHTFFALLCFLVAIILLSVFLGNGLDGFSSMLVLLGVIAFGTGGIYLLGHRPSQEHEEENDFAFDDGEGMEEEDGVVEGTIVASSLVQDDDEEDEIVDEDDTETTWEDEDNEEWENGGSDDDEDFEEDEVEDDVEDEIEDNGGGEDDEEGLNAFKTLVEEALDSIPLEFRERMENLAILVETEPDREVLQRVGTREGYTLLGLYEGTPLTAQRYQGKMLPERITIYQRTIEAYCHGDPERIRQQVRATLLHEVAHHFGIDHDEMPIWVK